MSLFSFKQIGTSGKWVMSVLAVAGGVYYWMQPTEPVPNPPQPQYEVLLMHADLERSYAMARERSYLDTHAANVSQIVTGSLSQITATSSLQSGSFGIVYSRYQTASCMFHPSTGITLYPIPDGKTGTIVSAASPAYNLKLWYTNNIWRTDRLHPYIGGEVFWRASNSSSYVLYPRQWTLGAEYSANAPSYPNDVCGIITLVPSSVVVPLYKYQTNAVAVVWTNTIGLFPNATFQYPNNIRSDIPSRTLSTGIYHWMLPSNEFMQTGSWDGNFIGRSVNPTNRWHDYTRDPYGNIAELDSDSVWWTNWVTYSTAHRITMTNYYDAQGLRSTTNYNYTYPTNCNLNKAFAFERDNSSLPWSTNSLNDMKRVLSLMQWQKVRIDWQSALSNYTYIVLDGLTCTSGENPKAYANLTETWDVNDPPILNLGYIRQDSGGYFYTRYPSTAGDNFPRAYIWFYCYWSPAWSGSSELYAFNVWSTVNRSRCVYTPPSTNFCFNNGYFLIDTMWWAKPMGFSYDMGRYDWPEAPGIDPPTGLLIAQPETQPYPQSINEQEEFVSGTERRYTALYPRNFSTHGEAVTSDWVVAYAPPLPSDAWMQAAYEQFIDDVYAITDSIGHAYNGNPWQNNANRTFSRFYGWSSWDGWQDRGSEAYGHDNHAGYATTHLVFESVTNYLNHAPPR